MYSSPEVDRFPVQHSRHGTRVGHSPHQCDSRHTLVVSPVSVVDSFMFFDRIKTRKKYLVMIDRLGRYKPCPLSVVSEIWAGLVCDVAGKQLLNLLSLSPLSVLSPGSCEVTVQ